MSTVTNIILLTHCGENAEAVKNWLAEFFLARGERNPPVNLSSEELVKRLGDQWYGGTKALETDAYMGAFNYFDDVNGLVDAVGAFPWTSPQQVQLLVREQEDDSFLLAWGEVRLHRSHPKCRR